MDILYCFDINHKFKVIYKHQIHYENINNLIIIYNDSILTCSSDNSLVIASIEY